MNAGRQTPEASKGQAKPFLTLEHVSLRLQDRVVFEDTRWEILHGQQWAVLGPNGSGKSLLVRAILGKIPVVEGQILYPFLDKRPQEEEWEFFGRLRDLMAWVSPDSGKGLPGQGSGFHQLRWNSFLNTESPRVCDTLFHQPPGSSLPFQVPRGPGDSALPAQMEKEVIGLLGIEGLLQRQMSVLSDGEMRRVLIAQALLRAPRLLVLENPFTGLDTARRASLRRIIGKVMEGRTLVILVTARAEEIPESATHVLWVERNRVLAQGPKEEILERYGMIAGSESAKWGPSARVPRGARKAKDRHPAGEALLELRKVRVSYDGVDILKGVTWRIRKGEHWALLGPNGAGKSTLLSLILGDNPQAYANDIVVFGRRRGSGETIWELKGRVGWVSPELHLHYPRRFTCLEVVCSGFFDSVGLFRRVSEDQLRSAESLLRDLGIGDRAERTLGSVSYGEQRMALLGRALVKRPALLVLDEPCQGLDPEHRRWFVDTVDGFGRRGETTILYVTHERDELPPVLTHALLLGKGRVARRGPIEEVLQSAGVVSQR